MNRRRRRRKRKPTREIIQRNGEYEKPDGKIAEITMSYDGNRWRILTVYSQNTEETMNTITELIQEEEEEHIMIGGDLNARTGNEGGPVREEEGKVRTSRKSRDRVINGEGRILVSKVEERGWMILNGSYKEEGGWTYR